MTIFARNFEKTDSKQSIYMTYEQALNRAAAYCSQAERAPHDVEQKLSDWEVAEADAARIMQRLRDEHFLDEARFVHAFVNDKFTYERWGRVKIAYALRQKGIAGALVQNTMADVIDEDAYVSRPPTPEEVKVIELLVAKANIGETDWKEGLMVIEMSEGMGSLLLIPKGQNKIKRQFKAQISEILFKDIDDIDVLISLNIDQDNFLYELDVWKMNYEKVISFTNLFVER